jgi:hypothetical protein
MMKREENTARAQAAATTSMNLGPALKGVVSVRRRSSIAREVRALMLVKSFQKGSQNW